MGVIQVQLPDELKSLIDRQIAEGKIASETAFFVEAARRFVEDLAAEDEVISEAKAGIADADAGRLVTIASSEDIEDLHERTMARCPIVWRLIRRSGLAPRWASRRSHRRYSP